MFPRHTKKRLPNCQSLWGEKKQQNVALYWLMATEIESGKDGSHQNKKGHSMPPGNYIVALIDRIFTACQSMSDGRSLKRKQGKARSWTLFSTLSCPWTENNSSKESKHQLAVVGDTVCDF